MYFEAAAALLQERLDAFPLSWRRASVVGAAIDGFVKLAVSEFVMVRFMPRIARGVVGDNVYAQLFYPTMSSHCLPALASVFLKETVQFSDQRERCIIVLL